MCARALAEEGKGVDLSTVSLQREVDCTSFSHLLGKCCSAEAIAETEGITSCSGYC